MRKFLNFVFLRRKMYINTSTEQKTKNTKNAVGPIPTAFLKPHRQHFVLPPLLRRRPLLSALQTFPPINGGNHLLKNGRHNSVNYILACFRSFINSLRRFVPPFIFVLSSILRTVFRVSKQHLQGLWTAGIRLKFQ